MKLKQILAVLTLSTVLFISAGCSTTQQETAYKATSAAVTSVDTLMKAWGNFVKDQAAAGTPVPDATRAKVRDAYNKYYSAALLVIDAETALASSTATNSAGGSPDLSSLSATASQALSDLVSLLQTLGVKL